MGYWLYHMPIRCSSCLHLFADLIMKIAIFGMWKQKKKFPQGTKPGINMHCDAQASDVIWFLSSQTSFIRCLLLYWPRRSNVGGYHDITSHVTMDDASAFQHQSKRASPCLLISLGASRGTLNRGVEVSSYNPTGFFIFFFFGIHAKTLELTILYNFQSMFVILTFLNASSRWVSPKPCE